MGLRIGLIAFILLSICLFLCLFSLNLGHSFLRNYANMALIWRISDCIVGLSLRLNALILHVFFSVLSVTISHVSIENLCHSFLITY